MDNMKCVWGFSYKTFNKDKLKNLSTDGWIILKMDLQDITWQCVCLLQTNTSILFGIGGHYNDTEMLRDKLVKVVHSNITIKT